MAQLSQNPPEGIVAQIWWCIQWIFQLRGRTSSNGGTDAQSANQIVVGTGSGVTSYPDFTYDPTGQMFNAGFSGNSAIQALESTGHIIAGIGDLSGTGNHTQLGVNDNLNTIAAQCVNDGSGNYGPGMYLDGQGHVYTIGDVNNIVHGTFIKVNDATQLITITNVPTYADDALAVIGGLLTTGQLYKSTTGGVTSLHIVP